MNNRICQVEIDFSRPVQPIRCLHGVNNGPIAYGGLTDVSDYYSRAKFPLVRLHDCQWPEPDVVDVSTIFRDFSKDANDPASYHFGPTDQYLKSVVATGAKIVYRLGESIEHRAIKYRIHPPADFQKWALVCTRIIDHYNKQWADGFEFDIQYWEIWNEPESAPNSTPLTNMMWSGTQDQYLDLYQVTSQAVRQAHPNVKVGGPGLTMTQPEFTNKFLDFVVKTGVPLDFLSWHTYAANLTHLTENVRLIRRLLDERGLHATESHCNEWNFSPSVKGTGVLGKGNEFTTREFFEKQHGVQGASFVTAVLCELQDLPMDAANYYDGQPTSFWGLFDPYGVPRLSYFAMLAFSRVAELNSRVWAVVQGEDPVRVLAAASDRMARVLVSNHAPTPVELDLHTHCHVGSGTCLIVDSSTILSPSTLTAEQGPQVGSKLLLPAYSFALLEYQR